MLVVVGNALVKDADKAYDDDVAMENDAGTEGNTPCGESFSA